MNRHLSRTIAMQSIYEWDFRPEENLKNIADRNISIFIEDIDKEYVRKVLKGIQKHLKEIDGLIIKAAPEWPIEQVSPIDKAILRLSIYEMLLGEEIPPKVAINEAVELAKTFGSENSSKFINGVLGTLYRQSDRYNPEDDKPPIGEGKANLSTQKPEVKESEVENERKKSSKI